MENDIKNVKSMFNDKLDKKDIYIQQLLDEIKLKSNCLHEEIRQKEKYENKLKNNEIILNQDYKLSTISDNYDNKLKEFN